MVGSKKKEVVSPDYKPTEGQSLKGGLENYNKSALGTYKKPYLTKTKVKTKKKVSKNATKQASERFKMITQRAQSIREEQPKMKWKNAIKKASKELF